MANEDQLKQAIALIRAGELKTGGTILHDLLRTDRDIELAWLWLTACVDSVDDKRYCLNEVLRINPDNEHARMGLDRLGQSPNQVPEPPTAEQTSDSEVLARLDVATSTAQVAAQPEPPVVQPVVSPPARPAVQPARAAPASRPAPTTRTGSNNGLLLAVLVILLVIAVSGMAVLLMNPRLIVGTSDQPTDKTQGFQVEYIVTGSAERVQVSYTNAANQTEILEVRQLPFSKKVDVAQGSTPRIVVTVQNLTSYGAISCEIKINQVSKTTNNSSAPNGFTSCSTLP